MENELIQKKFWIKLELSKVLEYKNYICLIDKNLLMY